MRLTKTLIACVLVLPIVAIFIGIASCAKPAVTAAADVVEGIGLPGDVTAVGAAAVATPSDATATN